MITTPVTVCFKVGPSTLLSSYFTLPKGKKKDFDLVSSISGIFIEEHTILVVAYSETKAKCNAHFYYVEL